MRWRALIVGAGPCGLTALKHLLQEGVAPVVALEQADDVGGNWLYDPTGRGHSSAYASLHAITSKGRSAFADFPLPAEFPDYPSHRQLQAYFRAYAERFNLLPHIRFGVRVERALPVDRGWRLWTSDGAVWETAFLVVASGHHWAPLLPEVPGRFTGEILHAHHYRTPEVGRGKRVLVVGLGNSGADIASEMARFACAAVVSLRRGYWIVPKFLFLGLPSDEIYHRLAWLPRPLRQRLTEAVVTLYNGGPRRAGLPRPDAPVFATHPVVNSELLLHLRHGRIAVRPDIARFDGNEVVFVDGRREPYDLVIFATGYAPRVPYLPAEFDPTGPALERLYLRIFPLDGSPLAFVGLIQPNGCLWNLAERQAQLVARHLSGRWQLPPDAAARTAREWAAHRRRYVASPRHRLEVDWHDYERALRRALAGR
jgi:cation diffusion facilitator CzcD-associated flavoprotein CzcO